MPIGSSVQVQYLSLTKHNKETHAEKLRHCLLGAYVVLIFCSFYFIGIYFDILHLIFCDSHRVGDGQKAFFDTVVEYSACKYLGNYLDGKHNRHTTWYLNLKEKKSYVKLL